MPPRAAISNGIITLVIVFFMILLGLLLKARYRLASEPSAPKAVAVTEVPKAIPAAVPVQETVHEARAYKQGDWWVLPSPELVDSRANEADTLRIRSGPKEDVFVLYFVDAAETSATRVTRVREQSTFFSKAPQEDVLKTGLQAQAFVRELLKSHPFKVYTKWGRVPESERYYAFITVEMQKGQPPYDLGEILVRKGFAAPLGQQTGPLPPQLPPSDKYVAQLGTAMTAARNEHAGAWAFAK
jgi:endonuclease YncB( thermonuclease family)